MDTASLRVAFAVVALCVLVLFYGATYRTTRAPYSGWWCVSMALYIVGASAFLANGTALQAVGTPTGNTLAVAGAASVLGAARSLRGRRTSLRFLLALPALVLVVTVFDHPGRDIWAGGTIFLIGMALSFGLASWELRQVLREGAEAEDGWEQHRFSLGAVLVVASAVAVFYSLRALVFVAVGPEHPAFRFGFGSQVTTLLSMAMLVVVTFSMSSLSHLQQTSELRVQAAHDGLTRLLNRNAFLRQAELVFDDDSALASGVVMVADLDGFKALNDGFGHAAGDRALTAFADVCRSVVGQDGLVGRLGGDEFAVLLPRGEHAEQIADTISRRFQECNAELANPTVSFGIAPIDRDVGVKDTIIRADVALYQAKAAGRDRVERYDSTVP
ncbi:GGDEF domain-containing protein [Nocardioides sp. R1-1]|uniref:GGDEF domain-containing protein n=1 Tax=Nocardioides sp. R1-1 TaxID=3383502 RepID=UPI0038D1546C